MGEHFPGQSEPEPIDPSDQAQYDIELMRVLSLIEPCAASVKNSSQIALYIQRSYDNRDQPAELHFGVATPEAAFDAELAELRDPASDVRAKPDPQTRASFARQASTDIRDTMLRLLEYHGYDSPAERLDSMDSVDVAIRSVLKPELTTWRINMLYSAPPADVSYVNMLTTVFNDSRYHRQVRRDVVEVIGTRGDKTVYELFRVNNACSSVTRKTYEPYNFLAATADESIDTAGLVELRGHLDTLNAPDSPDS